MLLIAALLVAVTLAVGARAARREGLISRHAYNNHYSDASAARDDHLG